MPKLMLTRRARRNIFYTPKDSGMIRVGIDDQHSSLDQRRRTAMYVIMLDDLLEVYLEHWPISFRDSDIREVRKQTQYRGDPVLIPRSHVRMIRREDKPLTNAQTGQEHMGAIYEQ